MYERKLVINLTGKKKGSTNYVHNINIEITNSTKGEKDEKTGSNRIGKSKKKTLIIIMLITG